MWALVYLGEAVDGLGRLYDLTFTTSLGFLKAVAMVLVSDHDPRFCHP